VGYKTASTLRGSGRTMAGGGSADLHLRYDLADLRSESQAFDRDNNIYHALINRAVDCILGTGFEFQARTKSARVNETLAGLWREFWADPEVRGMDDGQAVEHMAFRHLLVDGDNGTILDDESGRIQLIESERIDSTKRKADSGNLIEMGVELDKVGRPVAFHVRDYSDHGRLQSKTERIEVDRFIFCAHRDRITQTRGVPAMQSNFAQFHRINDVCDSEAIAWQLLSRFAVAINRKDAAELADAASTADENKTAGEDMTTRYTEIENAVMFHGEPGETIQGIDRNIPGANFSESLTMYLRLLGLPLGFPLELVLLDWSKTNYSSARASIKQAERMFKRWQRFLKRSWYGPIYRWKVERWIQQKKIQPRRDIYAHEWHAPAYPFVDPAKEEQARLLRYRSGVTSPERESAEAGFDFADLVSEQVRNLETAAAALEQFNENHPTVRVQLSDLTGFVAGPKPSTNGVPKQ
jgi:lambda family phage portal protein